MWRLASRSLRLINKTVIYTYTIHTSFLHTSHIPKYTLKYTTAPSDTKMRRAYISLLPSIALSPHTRGALLATRDRNAQNAKCAREQCPRVASSRVPSSSTGVSCTATSADRTDRGQSRVDTVWCAFLCTNNNRVCKWCVGASRISLR